MASSFCASRPRDATRRMSATELVCAAPPQQRLRRSSVAAALQPISTQLVFFVESLLEVLLAAPRGGTRQHLEKGRGSTSRGDASCAQHQLRRNSQKHQLRRSSSSRRRQCPATVSGRRGFYWAAPRIFGRTGCTGRDKLSVSRINLSKELRSLRGWPNQF